MPDDVQQTIRTRELRLVDEAGKDRAILTTDENGSVGLKFVDDAETTRLFISVGKTGETKLVLGHADKPAITVTVEAEGRFLMEAVDNQGIARMKMDMKANGSHTELSFSEQNRKPRMVMMAEDKGPAGLFILDQYGKALFSTTP